MMGRVSFISSGMTQSLPALRCLQRPVNQKTASSSTQHPHMYLFCKCERFSGCVFVCIFTKIPFYFFLFRFCGSCARIKEREEQEIPRAFEPLESEDKDSKALYALACFKGEQFRVGDGVYLPPESFNFRSVTSFKICSILKHVQ